MSITISNDDLHTANERLVLRIADLEKENDDLAGECRDAQSTAEQLAIGRDAALRDAETERTRADGLEAASIRLVEEHLRREEDLAALLRKSRAEAEGLAGVCRRLQDALDDVADKNRADAQAVDRDHAEQVARLVGVIAGLKDEIGALQLRLAASRSRFPRSRRPRGGER